jgi:hypothetical protein
MMETQNSNNSVMDWVNSHPSLAIGGLVLAALLIVGIIRSKNANQGATADTTATGDLSGLEKDANGNPVLYRVAEDQFISTSVIEDSYNTTTDSNNTTTVNPPPTVTPPPVLPPPSLPKSNGPLIPYDFFPDHKFPSQPGKPGTNVTSFTYNGVPYSIIPGAGGRIWGKANGTGPQVLLYAPASYY